MRHPRCYVFPYRSDLATDLPTKLGDFGGKCSYIFQSCQPWINKPLDCLVGRVPFKYHIMTIGGVTA